jgi:hypothetical protein
MLAAKWNKTTSFGSRCRWASFEYVYKVELWDILQRAESLAIWLQIQGCTEGKNLVLFVWNSAEWALFFWVAAN